MVKAVLRSRVERGEKWWNKERKEKEKIEDPSNKEKSLPKETNMCGPKDLEVKKEIPSGFEPKMTANPSSEKQEPKDG